MTLPSPSLIDKTGHSLSKKDPVTFTVNAVPHWGFVNNIVANNACTVEEMSHGLDNMREYPCNGSEIEFIDESLMEQGFFVIRAARIDRGESRRASGLCNL